MTLTPRTQRALYGVALLSAAAAAVATFLMPPVVQLGTLVRLVVLHGAYTWVNMGLFTLAGLVSAAFLLLGRASIYPWSTALRRLAVVAWVGNTALGMLSAYLSWGSVNLAEPRLRATFVLLLLSGILLALDFFVGRARVMALADIAMATALWWLILAARNFVHPDSPVMNSGWEIKGPFFAIVASIAVFALAVAVLLASRVADELAEGDAAARDMA